MNQEERRQKDAPPGASLLGGGLRAVDAGVRPRCHALPLPLCCGSVSGTAIVAACSQTNCASVALPGPGEHEVLWLHVPHQNVGTRPADGRPGTTTKSHGNTAPLDTGQGPVDPSNV